MVTRLALLTVLLALAGCTDVGPGLTDAPETLEVSSPTIPDEGAIPEVHTCDGNDRSPQLDIVALPQGARSIALVLDDPDASRGTFTHWVVFNVPVQGPSVTFPEGRAPPGAVPGTNSADRTGYVGPCPPTEDSAHRYHFQVLALDRMLMVGQGADRAEVLAAAEGHVLAWGELVGTYDR